MMRQIINGLRYDTKMAEEIGDAYSSCDRGNFRYFEESLYRTKNGRFFLAGHGGALTKYAQPVGNSGHTSGSRIIPLSREEAQSWAEDNLPAGKVEEYFGDSISDA